MIVVANAAEGVGKWHTFKRNIAEDFEKAFGEKPGPVIGVGVLTDTDKLGEKVEAWYGDMLLPLTTAEFDILELLVRRAGLAVSRDEIMAALHQRPASPYERTLDVHMSHLRRKLQAAGIDPIRTVRGIGYLFARS